MFTKQEFEDKLSHFRQVVTTEEVNELVKTKTELEAKTLESGFWDNSQEASKISKEIAELEAEIGSLHGYLKKLDDLVAAFEMADESELASTLTILEEDYKRIEFQKYLNGRFDSRDALLSVHAGAGGVDAQDFASMLVAMYQGFAKKQNWTGELIYLSSGEEGGVKSATIKISGRFAYGLLKEEAGVHRLVRLSPFNSGNTRETSFALVEVLPEGLDEQIEVDIKDEDLSWDYFMASGKGGQSVNTTYSAVRVVHQPTGISVSCQNERSQQQNKQTALKYLKNKLAVIEMKKQREMASELKGELQSAEWGSQIRSYVNHPYKLVKDHRSGHELQNVDRVFDGGELLEFIWAMKKSG